jgi:TPR repeat protein
LRKGDASPADRAAHEFDLWLKAAEQGDAGSQHRVGDAYMNGVGVARSIGEARRWLTAAALQSHVPAMVLLGGLLLQHADGSADAGADRAQAADLFARAAEQDNVDAQYNLGVCFRLGLGVARDDVAAALYYGAAAEKGHSSAQLAFGSLKAQTAASETDWSRVVHWYRLAAEAGHPTAMLALAQLQEQGRGTPKDRAGALMLYRQARDAGLADAATNVQRLEASLRQPEIAGA